MLGARLEVGYSHLHRLDLLVFGRDGADFVAHLIAFNWHILTLDAGGGGKERKKRGFRIVELSCPTLHEDRVKASKNVFHICVVSKLPCFFCLINFTLEMDTEFGLTAADFSGMIPANGTF